MAAEILEDNSVAPWLGYSSATGYTSQENVELVATYYRVQLSLEANNIHPRMSCFKGGSKFQPYAVLKLLANDLCLGKTEW